MLRSRGLIVLDVAPDDSALYAFFLSGIDAAGAWLRHFVSRAAQATRVGSVFDDAQPVRAS